MYVVWGLLLLLLAAQFIYDAPLEHHADPMRTPLLSQAPWFFLWVQGLLKFGDTLLMGLVVPGVLFVLLFILPLIDWCAKSPGKDRSIAVILVLLSGLGLVGLSMVGTSEHGIERSPMDRFIQRYIPEEGGSPLEKIPFDDLRSGIYGSSAETATEEDSLLHMFLQDFQRDVKRLIRETGNQSLEATMVIDEWQKDLKRITLRLKWQEKGQVQSKDGHVYAYNQAGQ